MAEETHTWLHLFTGCFNCLEENFLAYTLDASADWDCDVLRGDESGVLGQQFAKGKLRGLDTTAGNPQCTSRCRSFDFSLFWRDISFDYCH